MTDRHQHSEAQQIADTRNTARFFTETRHISWVLLIGTLLWGVYGYFQMPQRKDPDIPIRQALALCTWPGAAAEKIEQLVTERLEEKIAENVNVEKIESNTRTGVTVVYITLVEGLRDTGKEFDDIKLKLDTITDLPDGAGPITFIKDFGDTAALMLTVASPRVGDAELALRAAAVQRAIETVRAGTPGSGRVTLIQGLPTSIPGERLRRPAHLFAAAAAADSVLIDPRIIEGAGFIGVDGLSDRSDEALHEYLRTFIQERQRESEFHPDSWLPIIVRDPAQTAAQIAAAAGDKYSYRDLDDYTDLISRTLKTLPMVSKVTRSGLLEERIYLEYSQERLTAYGVQVGALRHVLSDRNITLPGGTLEVGDKNLTIDPSGEFRDEQEIGDVLVPTSSGRRVYLRDLVSVGRGYEGPARFLNFYSSRDRDGDWRRSRAITLAVQMRSGGQIGEFGRAVDASLEQLRAQLPEDLVLARTSDQPRQVEENVDLFMGSLYEAVVLVVLVSLIGFREWRSALLMALSIPITLAMTFQTDELERQSPPAQAGYRGRLLVPVRLHGETLGALDFLSFDAGIYVPTDALVARRIADHVALALSHQRLAEQARHNEELRAREARLEMLRTEAATRAEKAQELAGALESRVKFLAAELNAVTGYRWVVGQSAPWTGVLKQATQVASTNTTVLLLGESGTGKEVVARFIHRASERSGGPFVAINCAALPEPLLESELFGFERGAFTGAMQAKPGQVEQASGGVLFLDEVGEMTLAVQAKFLRVLQEREFQRLGSTRTLKANVRVIAATNRDLRTAIQRGAFREDLYYRLNVFAVQLPPLRQRRDDILPLSEAFLGEIAKSLGRPPAGISREARDQLLAYDWPGNVRELRNTLERAAILCEGGLVTTEHLTFSAPVEPLAPAGATAIQAPMRVSAIETTDLRILERTTIQRALEEARYNKSQAARSLGLTRKQLYVRLRQHGLES